LGILEWGKVYDVAEGKIMKYQARILISIVFLFFTLGTSVGQKKPEWNGRVELKNGVKIIKNPKEPLFEKDIFHLQEELCLGDSEGKDEYMFIQLWYLAVDDNENIYAMDQGASHIKVFDKEGNFMRHIGRKGEGPGEFQNPNRIFITDGGHLVVEDFIRNLTYFSLDGIFSKSVSTSSMFPIAVEVCPNGKIIALTNEPDPNNYGKDIGLYSEGLVLLSNIVHIPEYKPKPQVLRIFEPEINWTVTTKSELIIAYKMEYEIHVFDENGRLSKKIIKEHEPVKVTKEDVTNKVRKNTEGLKLEIPEHHTAIQFLLVDDAGHIYVKTFEKENTQQYYYDIFDSNWQCITKVLLKDRMQVVKNNRLYSIEEDDEGFQYIKRYKITWNY
jgi:hypothetical protein